MSLFERMMNSNQLQRGTEGFLYLTCSATSDWTDQDGKSVGTTTTSGIYHMKAPAMVVAISAAADAAAIIYLPPAANHPLGICGFYAPTAATAGDISIYDWETGSEITTYGDLDADNDHVVFISVGYQWVLLYDGVA